MTGHKPKPHATPRELLLFYAKLIGFLLALTVFGFVIFLIAKSLQIHR